MTYRVPASLVLTSGFATQPGQRVLVVMRLPPELAVFRPGSFHFSQPSGWQIHDFKMGNRSQLKRDAYNANGISAAAFEDALLDDGCNVLRRDEDLSMEASWQRVGEAVFSCEIKGWGAK